MACRGKSPLHDRKQDQFLVFLSWPLPFVGSRGFVPQTMEISSLYCSRIRFFIAALSSSEAVTMPLSFVVVSFSAEKFLLSLVPVSSVGFCIFTSGADVGDSRTVTTPWCWMFRWSANLSSVRRMPIALGVMVSQR